MERIKTEISQEDIEHLFRSCAAEIAASASLTVYSKLRAITPRQISGITEAEIAKLNNFRLDQQQLEDITEKAVRSFVDGQSGFKRLFANARLAIGQQAIRTCVHSYRRSDRIDPVTFYRSRYEFLFKRLGLPLYRISRVDANLNNDMPHTAARSVGPR